MHPWTPYARAQHPSRVGRIALRFAAAAAVAGWTVGPAEPAHAANKV